MKVLHIIEIRGIGGAEKMLIEFLNAQQNANNQIYCILIFNKHHEQVMHQLQAKLHEKEIKTILIQYLSIKGIILLSHKIGLQIKYIQPQVIHTHLKIAETCLALLKLIGLQVPVVTTVHGYGDEFQNQFISGTVSKISRTPRYYLTLFILRQLDAYAFISNFLMKFYLESRLIENTNKAVRIDNAIKITTQNLPANTTDINNIKIILPGRLIEWKGHIYAFEAIKILSKKYPNIKLDCYGVGPYEASLKVFIKKLGLNETINLKGFTENIIEKIREYDIVIIPSLFESFGIVFLDAFKANVPVVAFDIPAGNEIITDNINGLLAEPLNSRSLADEIAKLIENNKLKDTIVKNAQKLLLEKYNMELMVRSYTDLYQKLLTIKK